MKTILSITAVIALFGATAAMACNTSPPPNCSCKNNQWVNNVTNQVWNSTTNTYNTNVNNSVNKSTNVNGVNGNVGSTSGATSTATGGTANATGGAGGQGGQGGAGGSVSGSGNSTNTNNVAGGSATIAKGAVTNNNSQQQKQGQTQTATGGTSSVTGSGNSSIAAGAVTNTVGSSSTSTASNNGNLSNVGSGNGSNNTTSASADGAGANNGNNSNNTSVTFQAAKTYRQPVATAYAASLTSGFDTCLGSVSGGAQTQILGLSIGGTKTDKNCVLIKQTQLLREMDMAGAACFRARMGKEGADIDRAMKQAGVTCNVLEPVVVERVVEVPGPERVVIQEVPVKKTGQ